MKKEEIKASVMDFYRDYFAIGRAAGLSEADVAQKLYDDYEISYDEMLAFKEEKKND